MATSGVARPSRMSPKFVQLMTRRSRPHSRMQHAELEVVAEAAVAAQKGIDEDCDCNCFEMRKSVVILFYL